MKHFALFFLDLFLIYLNGKVCFDAMENNKWNWFHYFNLAIIPFLMFAAAIEFSRM